MWGFLIPPVVLLAYDLITPSLSFCNAKLNGKKLSWFTNLSALSSSLILFFLIRQILKLPTTSVPSSDRGSKLSRWIHLWSSVAKSVIQSLSFFHRLCVKALKQHRTQTGTHISRRVSCIQSMSFLLTFLESWERAIYSGKRSRSHLDYPIGLLLVEFAFEVS